VSLKVCPKVINRDLVQLFEREKNLEWCMMMMMELEAHYLLIATKGSPHDGPHNKLKKFLNIKRYM